jgi:hypothetical protein
MNGTMRTNASMNGGLMGRGSQNGTKSPIPKRPATQNAGQLGPIQHRNLTLK